MNYVNGNVNATGAADSRTSSVVTTFFGCQTISSAGLEEFYCNNSFKCHTNYNIKCIQHSDLLYAECEN